MDSADPQIAPNNSAWPVCVSRLWTWSKQETGLGGWAKTKVPGSELCDFVCVERVRVGLNLMDYAYG